jgi:hypothetical protein
MAHFEQGGAAAHTAHSLIKLLEEVSKTFQKELAYTFTQTNATHFF